jgi:hypothetical protein
MYYERIFTDLGALIVDGPNYFEDFRPAGYIDRILKCEAWQNYRQRGVHTWRQTGSLSTTNL